MLPRGIGRGSPGARRGPPAWAACRSSSHSPSCIWARARCPQSCTGVLIAAQVFFIGSTRAPLVSRTDTTCRAQALGVLVGLIGGASSSDSTSSIRRALCSARSRCWGPPSATRLAASSFRTALRTPRLACDGLCRGRHGRHAHRPRRAPHRFPNMVPGEPACYATVAIGVLGTALALAIYPGASLPAPSAPVALRWPPTWRGVRAPLRLDHPRRMALAAAAHRHCPDRRRRGDRRLDPARPPGPQQGPPTTAKPRQLCRCPRPGYRRGQVIGIALMFDGHDGITWDAWLEIAKECEAAW